MYVCAVHWACNYIPYILIHVLFVYRFKQTICVVADYRHAFGLKALNVSWRDVNDTCIIKYIIMTLHVIVSCINAFYIDMGIHTIYTCRSVSRTSSLFGDDMICLYTGNGLWRKHQLKKIYWRQHHAYVWCMGKFIHGNARFIYCIVVIISHCNYWLLYVY